MSVLRVLLVLLLLLLSQTYLGRETLTVLVLAAALTALGGFLWGIFTLLRRLS